MKKGADLSGANCKLIHLTDVTFNSILNFGYRKITELENDLIQIQEDILSANDLVLVYPTWWGTYPALLKGFIDRGFSSRLCF